MHFHMGVVWSAVSRGVAEVGRHHMHELEPSVAAAEEPNPSAASESVWDVIQLFLTTQTKGLKPRGPRASRFRLQMPPPNALTWATNAAVSPLRIHWAFQAGN